MIQFVPSEATDLSSLARIKDLEALKGNSEALAADEPNPPQRTTESARKWKERAKAALDAAAQKADTGATSQEVALKKIDDKVVPSEDTDLSSLAKIKDLKAPKGNLGVLTADEPVEMPSSAASDAPSVSSGF